MLFEIPRDVAELAADCGYDVGGQMLEIQAIPHGLEIGGALLVVGGKLVAVELPNIHPDSHRNHYYPDLDALARVYPDAEVFGIWHTHWNDAPPSAQDKRAQGIWAAEYGVPVFAIFSDTKSWWLS